MTVARVSQNVVEILRTNTQVKARASQVMVEVLRQKHPGNATSRRWCSAPDAGAGGVTDGAHHRRYPRVAAPARLRKEQVLVPAELGAAADAFRTLDRLEMPARAETAGTTIYVGNLAMAVLRLEATPAAARRRHMALAG